MLVYNINHKLVPILVLRYSSLVLQRRYSSECLHPEDHERRHKTPPIVRSEKLPIALYGGRHTVSLVPGTGVGAEFLGYVKQVFKYAGAPVDFETVDVAPDEDVDHVITSILRNGVAIKGNIETTSVHIPVRNIAIRNALDLYVYVFWCKSLPNVPAVHKDVDVVVIRQNVEGEYSMLEHEAVPGVVENLKVITEHNSERVARYAFEYAKRNNRKKITTVHKANIMKLSDGFFLKTCRKIAADYPEILHDDVIIDNCCMQLVSKPQQFDMLLTPNLYGNICSSILCGIAGGAGLYSGKNFSDHYAIFETGARCTCKEMMGKNEANPTAMLNASVDMLYHLGHECHAKVIEDAIYKTIVEDQVRTVDIGGSATATQFVSHIIGKITQNICHV